MRVVKTEAGDCKKAPALDCYGRQQQQVDEVEVFEIDRRGPPGVPQAP
ncbi:hypothetical protein [Paenibacillus sp. 481]|nr:hypothetical protein [Paenibacillus sp. 481]UHA71750.1 hypothetical protein KIK04_13290 [Paenibacillus sp. 481]